jgi:hypothetical protein
MRSQLAVNGKEISETKSDGRKRCCSESESFENYHGFCARREQVVIQNVALSFPFFAARLLFFAGVVRVWGGGVV